MIRWGSRGSALALTQARLVAATFAAKTGDAEAPIQSFVTSGDRIADRRLQDAGGKGLFTKELDEALRARRIDAAIHSLKDLPTQMPAGIALAAIPAREDPRDALIAREPYTSVKSLPRGATIGTASLRRQAQTLYLRPDLKIVTLRGSVQTRLKRIADGGMDATFLALAGLARLGLANHASSVIAVDDMPPAPGQGALAITCRADDAKTRDVLAKLSVLEFEIAAAAERGFLAALDGSCRTPIGALARIEGGRLYFLGEVLAPDGRQRWRGEERITLGANPRAEAEALGRKMGAEIRAEAGEEFIQSLEKRAW